MLFGSIRITKISVYKFIMTDNPQKSKKSTVKLTDLQQSALYSNHLNNSTSKMLYSIPKSPRWSSTKKSDCEPKLYELPSLNSNRATSFGYGNKIDIGKLAGDNPPPNSYNLHSEFELSKKKGTGIGLGRDMVKAVSAFGQKPFIVPGVGTYTTKQPESHQSICFSSRMPDVSDKWAKVVPGPGAYSTLELLDKNLRIQVSKYESARSQKFSKGVERGSIQRLIKKQNIPGPGQYSATNKTYDLIDRFSRQNARSFSRSPRPDIANKSGVPGPGSYKHLSEFIH